jgi:hypothetical protein
MSEKGRGLARGLALTAAALAVIALGMLTRAQTDGGVDGGADAGATDGGLQGTLLDFHMMTPVSGPYVGNSNPIRGINGGGLPWTLDHADGTLRADGALEVNLSGLVLAKESPVPQAQQGTNVSATFTAIVSCMSTDASGVPVQTNVSTHPAPATATGNAEIRAKLALPSPCLAPILFVVGANGTWFATTGSPSQATTADGGTADAGTSGGGR